MYLNGDNNNYVKGFSVLSAMKNSRRGFLAFLLVTALTMVLYGHGAQAIPAYARQTGEQCNACHEPYPQLNEYGREFKMMGYTQQAGNLPSYKRFAAMLQPSLTHTGKDQAPAAAPHFAENDNWAVTQASIFYGGRLLNSLDRLGSFIQVTYDGVERAISWDLADFRLAGSGELAGGSLIYGLDINNTPGVQDPWNTSPAWNFPFSGSGVAPGPAATTLIADPLAGTVAGIGAYAYWNDTAYGEVNFYQTLGHGFLKAMGVNSVDQEIDGAAPYWRFALQHQWGLNQVEVGSTGLYARTYPGRDHSAGTDRYVDTGLDAQYQYLDQRHHFTGRLAWIHEDQKLNASHVLGGTNASNHLDTVALSGSYLYDRTYGIDLGYNHISGSADAGLYEDAVNGSPDSDYETVQLDWLPFNKNGGPDVYQWFNPKLSLQYTLYNRLDGATAHVSDNDTLYLQAWLMF